MGKASCVGGRIFKLFVFLIMSCIKPGVSDAILKYQTILKENLRHNEGYIERDSVSLKESIISFSYHVSGLIIGDSIKNSYFTLNG